MAKIRLKWATCPKCDGEGSIPGERDYDHNDIPIMNWDPCYFCKGTGKTCMEVKIATKLRNTTNTHQ